MRLSTKLVIAMALVAGILHLSVRSAAADQIAFAVDNTENLYRVDLTTATATPIGYTGQFLQGLAVSPLGVLFGTDYLLLPRSTLMRRLRTPELCLDHTNPRDAGSPRSHGPSVQHGPIDVARDWSRVSGATQPAIYRCLGLPWGTILAHNRWESCNVGKPTPCRSLAAWHCC